MIIETKFNTGDAVFFLCDNKLFKGVITEICINVTSVISEVYEVTFINRDNKEITKDISEDNLFKSSTALVDKLMLDLEKREEEND